eukprot:2678648-Alexandrium_andersonii.AAC.1
MPGAGALAPSLPAHRGHDLQRRGKPLPAASDGPKRDPPPGTRPPSVLQTVPRSRRGGRPAFP